MHLSHRLRNFKSCSQWNRFCVLPVALFAMLLAGCGGSGGGGTISTSSTTSSSSNVVTGDVASPSGSLTSFARAADGTALSTTDETGVAGLTVTVGTIDASGISGSVTFTPVAGATTTSATDGTFTITLPAGTSITGNTVIVASQGTAPTNLPASGVLVSPVINGRVLVDPVTTAATTYLCQQAATTGVALANLNRSDVQTFLAAAEETASTSALPANCTLSQIEQIVTTSITGSSTTGLTLNGVIVNASSGNQHGTNGTLTSGSAFTTGPDSSSTAYNGTATKFVADKVGAMPDHHSMHIYGSEHGSSAVPSRSFDILISSTGTLAAGTYSSSITYAESVLPATSTSDTVPPVPTNQDGFGPGRAYLGGSHVSLWSASSVTVTVTAGTTSASPFNISVAPATYSPIASSSGKTNSTGTLTTALTGTVLEIF